LQAILKKNQRPIFLTNVAACRRFNSRWKYYSSDKNC